MNDRQPAPRAGDIIVIDLSPVAGHEQAGNRPVLVISERIYNEKTGLAVVAPLTTHIKGYAFEVPIESGTPRPTVVLADAVRSIDWRARNGAKRGSVSPQCLKKVRMRVAQVIGLIQG
jgi:mRNA interferase MazF